MKQNIYDNDDFFEGYMKIRNRKHNYNNMLEQPHFRMMLPDLEGMRILDVGCGMGDFAAYCVERGATHVHGIDISKNMIAKANEQYASNQMTFQQLALEDTTFQDESFDLITSSLVLHYIADFDAAIKKLSTALKVGGILQFSINHPIVSATFGDVDEILDDHGNLKYFVMDHYMEEGMRELNWLVDGIQMYHRPLSTIINTCIQHGLNIQQVVEPVPSAETLVVYPHLQRQFRRPAFCIIQLKKR